MKLGGSYDYFNLQKVCESDTLAYQEFMKDIRNEEYAFEVVKLYQGILGRDPAPQYDPTGIDEWYRQLRDKKVNVTQIANIFLNSEEWKNKNINKPLPDTGGITTGGGGVSSGGSGMTGTYRADPALSVVARDISNSYQEEIARQILALYLEILGRNPYPEQGKNDVWYGYVIEGRLTLEGVRQAFLNSEEYKNKKTKPYYYIAGAGLLFLVAFKPLRKLLGKK